MPAGSAVAVSFGSVRAFEEMIVGSPEFRAEARERLAAPPRWPAVWWFVLAAGLAVGAWLVGWGVVHLREAHLYRQSWGEGLKFAVIGFAYVAAHGLFLAAGYAIARLRAGTRSEGVRRALLALGVLMVIGLVSADAVYLSVEWHGDRCVGACG